MAWGRLADLVNNRKELDSNRALRFAFTDRDIQETVLNLNRWNQLFDFGVDADGDEVGYYSAFTEMMYRGQSFKGKQKIEGEPYFFLDSGWLFESFYFRRDETGITIGSTDIDKLEDNVKTPERLLGLTEESREELNEKVLPHVRAWILKTLLK